MIAVDTNILLHAHREDSPLHAKAAAALERAAASGSWAIPWPCIHEFLAIATHPRIYKPPTPLPEAMRAVRRLVEAPGIRLLGERDGYWDALEDVLQRSKVEGPRVHDARIAALCRQDGIDELWTADRDFSRFADVRAKNPLVD